MYGSVGKITAVSGGRGRLAEILAGMGSMPGCRSSIAALDPSDDALWVTEVWESAEAHQDSLRLPEVQEAVAEDGPLVAAFDPRFETVPIGLSRAVAFEASGPVTAPPLRRHPASPRTAPPADR